MHISYNRVSRSVSYHTLHSHLHKLRFHKVPLCENKLLSFQKYVTKLQHKIEHIVVPAVFHEHCILFLHPTCIAPLRVQRARMGGQLAHSCPFLNSHPSGRQSGSCKSILSPCARFLHCTTLGMMRFQSFPASWCKGTFGLVPINLPG